MLRSSIDSSLFARLRKRVVQDSPQRRLMQSEHGASLIETAVSLTLLMLMIFGVINVSLATYTFHAISEAAREGTRYAIVRGSSCTGFTSACPAAKADVQTYVRGLGIAGITTTSLIVTTTWPTTGATCTPSPAPTCNNPGNLVKVVVSYPFTLTVPLAVTHSYALTMTSTSQMVIAR